MVGAGITPLTSGPKNREIAPAGAGEHLGSQGSLTDPTGTAEQDSSSDSLALDHLEMVDALAQLFLTPHEQVVGIVDSRVVVVDSIGGTLGSDGDRRAIDDASSFADSQLAAAVLVVDEFNRGGDQFLADGLDVLGALGSEFDDRLARLAGALFEQSTIAKVVDSSGDRDATAEPLFLAADSPSQFGQRARPRRLRGPPHTGSRGRLLQRG
jgi:hypothetical protein